MSRGVQTLGARHAKALEGSKRTPIQGNSLKHGFEVVLTGTNFDGGGVNTGQDNRPGAVRRNGD